MKNFTGEQILADTRFLLKVDSLSLSVRAKSCLQDKGLVYVAHVVMCTEDELLDIHGFGRVFLNQTVRALNKLGLTLGTHILGDVNKNQLEAAHKNALDDGRVAQLIKKFKNRKWVYVDVQEKPSNDIPALVEELCGRYELMDSHLGRLSDDHEFRAVMVDLCQAVMKATAVMTKCPGFDDYEEDMISEMIEKIAKDPAPLLAAAKLSEPKGAK